VYDELKKATVKFPDPFFY